MAYTKVVQVGAGGSLGQPILEALVNAGSFDITVLAREESQYTSPYSSVKVIKLDLHHQPTVVSSLKGVDVVLLTFGDFANLDRNSQVIIDAAIEAGVQRILPSEYGFDLASAPGRDQIVWTPKHKVNAYLAAKAAEGVIEYTTVATGAFFDWGLNNQFLGFDIANHKAVIFDEGKVRFNATTVASIGLAVVSILSNPIPFKNKYVRIHDFFVNQREILSELEAITGKKFLEERIDSAKLEEKSLAGLEMGEWTPENIYGLIKSYLFGKNASASWVEEDESGMLGLPCKTLKEEIVKAIGPA